MSDTTAELMHVEEYKAHLHKLVMMMQVAEDIPIAEMERFLSHMDAVAPIFAPSEWHWGGGSKNLDEQRDVLNACSKFVRESKRLIAKWKPE